jgi:WD40 repeat protein
MKRSLLSVLMICVGALPPVAAAPAPSQPVINIANAASLAKSVELPVDAWRIVRGTGRGEVSYVQWEGTIEVLDAGTLKSLRRLAPERKVVHFAFSKDGQRLALSENKAAVEIRDLRGGEPVSIKTVDSQPGVSFSPDGALLATGGYTRADLWDAVTGRHLRTLDSDVNGGRTILFSPDGKTLAVGNRNYTTRLFEVDSGKLLLELPQKMSQELKFSPDGKKLAVVYVDGSISLWSVADGTLLRSEKSGAEELYSVDWSPAGDVLATSGREGKITLWNSRELSILKELEAPPWVVQVRFSADGTYLLSAGGTVMRSPDRKITIWRPARR